MIWGCTSDDNGQKIEAIKNNFFLIYNNVASVSVILHMRPIVNIGALEPLKIKKQNKMCYLCVRVFMALLRSVSYTHLDVYKRQLPQLQLPA